MKFDVTFALNGPGSVDLSVVDARGSVRWSFDPTTPAWVPLSQPLRLQMTPGTGDLDQVHTALIDIPDASLDLVGKSYTVNFHDRATGKVYDSKPLTGPSANSDVVSPWAGSGFINIRIG